MCLEFIELSRSLGRKIAFSCRIKSRKMIMHMGTEINVLLNPSFELIIDSCLRFKYVHLDHDIT